MSVFLAFERHKHSRLRNEQLFHANILRGCRSPSDAYCASSRVINITAAATLSDFGAALKRLQLERRLRGNLQRNFAHCWQTDWTALSWFPELDWVPTPHTTAHGRTHYFCVIWHHNLQSIPYSCFSFFFLIDSETRPPHAPVSGRRPDPIHSNFNP